MEDIIYSVFKSYCDNNETLSKNALKELFELIRKEWKLESYCEKIEFDNDRNPNGIGSYIYKTKTINYDYERIFEITKKNDILRQNFHMFENLLHEFNHAKHYKYLIEKNELIQSGVKQYDDYLTICEDIILALNYSVDVYENDNIKGRDLYHNNFPLFTSERMCEIDSFEYIKYLALRYDTDIDRIKKIIELSDLAIHVWYIWGYKEEGKRVISSVDQFAKMFKLKKDFKLALDIGEYLINNNMCTKKDLFRLGLNVDYKTYQNYLNYSKEIEKSLRDSFVKTRRLTK